MTTTMPAAPASTVLAFPAPTPEQSRDFMAAKLSYHADAWDVAEDLRNGIDAIVVVDTRSAAHYEQGHVPGAISFPHRTMDEQSTAHLDRSKVYVTYCDGIGCNGSTRGAYKLARLGFTVKEIPIVFEDRRVGQSKMRRKIFVEALTMVWKLRLGV